MEVQRRPFIIGLLAVPCGAILGAVMMFVLGSVTRLLGLQVNFTVLVLIMPIITTVAAVWLFESRQRRGMHLTQYKAMLNRAKAKGKGGSTERMTGVFLVGGRIPEEPTFIMHQPLTVLSASKTADAPEPTVAQASRASRSRNRRRFNLEEL